MKITDISELKPIITRYKGYKFRSRLEARWAVFMDNLNIRWEYELEGYDLDGLWYLPDFWLPTFNNGCFLEVKPTKLNDKEFEKATRLCLISGHNVILAIGIPDYKCQQYLYREECNGDINIDIAHGLMNADKAEGFDRFFVYPGYEDIDLTIRKENYHLCGDSFKDAIWAAKSIIF